MDTTTAGRRPAYMTRLLPVEEWDRLKDFPIADQGLPDPDLSMILVDETASGEIIGIWGAFTAVHLDALWTDPAHRDNTMVAGQLLRGMKQALQDRGITIAFTMIQDGEVMCLAHKAGFTRAPGDLWILRLPALPPLPPPQV